MHKVEVSEKLNRNVRPDQRKIAEAMESTGRVLQGRWWIDSVSEEGVSEIIIAQVKALNRSHEERVNLLNAWYTLYTDSPQYKDTLEAALVQRDQRARFNVCQNAVDSTHSRITKNRPKPWVVTSGGQALLQQRAKALNKYMDGEFSRCDVPPLAAKCSKDSMIFGAGAMKVFAHDGRPKCERVLIHELLVDPREAEAGEIRTLYQVKAIDRGVLVEMYPEHLDIVATASWASMDDDYDSTDPAVVSDLILVVEAWHLRSGKHALDGRHSICVDSGTLFDEEWEADCFPFAFLNWADDPYGFWGVGLVERMAGGQSELNDTTRKISDAFTRSAPCIFTEVSAQFKSMQMDNEPWRVYSYVGVMPTFATPNAISPQFLQREAQLIDYSYQMQGISQMSAQSEKPAGLNSGKALRVHHDIETERFAAHGRDWETFHMEISKQILDCTEKIWHDEEEAREEAEKKGDDLPESELIVHVGEQTLEAIKYTDARLQGEPYDVRTFPVSALSSSPQGRLQDVQDLIELGVIQDPDDIRELLDYPDLEQYNDVHSAGRKLSDLMIEKALKGEKVQANPYLPLPYLHRMAIFQHALSEYEQSDNEKGRKRLRDLIGHVETLQKAAEEQLAMAAQAAQMAAQPPGPPPGAGPPPGPPGPPPGAPPGPPMLPPGMPGRGPIQ